MRRNEVVAVVVVYPVVAFVLRKGLKLIWQKVKEKRKRERERKKKARIKVPVSN